MTVGSQVKQCTYSLKSIEQGLLNLSLRTLDKESQAILAEASTEIKNVADDLDKRVGELELEEPQYKGL
ncbi:DUF1657 domain-containing protein [Bacillus sp. Marseille-P3661]|uniref:DUF1657 domain-containing protein n=1 Tax=Bacillus sp. Marseille-P3661 TaxID=1936234 RepID=UPI000C85853F|nr:DUF1657 domain-containing protein [Bacillus sp. Marseille-P3661]